LKIFLYSAVLCIAIYACSTIKSPNTIGIDYEYIPIYSNIEFTRDGKNLLFGDTTGRVIIWDLASNSAVNQLEGDHSNIHAITISPDGELIAAGKYDHKITIWQLSTGKRLRELIGQFYPVSSLQFSPDGKSLVSGGWDNWTILWNLETEKPKWIHRRKIQGSVNAVAFSESGRTPCRDCGL